MKPVDAATIDGVLSRQIDDLEPELTRHGYDAKSFGRAVRRPPARNPQAAPGGLDPARTRELTDEMRAAGLPL